MESIRAGDQPPPLDLLGDILSRQTRCEPFRKAIRMASHIIGKKYVLTFHLDYGR